MDHGLNGTITITNNLVVYAKAWHQYFWNNFECSEGPARWPTGNECKYGKTNSTVFAAWTRTPCHIPLRLKRTS